MSKGEKVAFGALVIGVWGSLFTFLGLNIYQSWTHNTIPGFYFASLVIIGTISVLIANFIFLPRISKYREQKTRIQRVVHIAFYIVCVGTMIAVALKYFGVVIPSILGNALVLSIGGFSILEEVIKKYKW